MKQLLQVLGTGEVRIVDVPSPIVRPGGVLVRNHASVISVGTDRTQIDFGRKSLLSKARQKPDRVRQVVRSVVRDGIAATRARVRRKLDSFVALGYSTAGVVVGVGEGVADLEVGQRVACAGAGYASHAELVCVPHQLVVPVPDGVPFEAAAFATMGAIALHGVRQAEIGLGSHVAVVGLGLLGQLTVQLATAAGAQVVAVDFDAARVELAARHGALGVRRTDPVEEAVAQATSGVGVDAVLITAATSSDDPIRLAGRIARDRGRVVVVGAVPMNVPRSPYYEKELELRLSRSYGPGRYDPAYEEHGHDYPIGYVRWTERRNLAEFLRLVEVGAVRLGALITDRLPLHDAPSVYAALSENAASPLGVVVTYPPPPSGHEEPRRIIVTGSAAPPHTGRLGVGFIGAGSFATDVLLPALARLDVDLVGVATARGVNARHAAEQFGFRYAAGDAQELLDDPGVHALFIATRHDEHARLAAAALGAGKAVFVEKPLALNAAELDAVLAATDAGGPLMVGFNRRFAPATRFVRERLARVPGARVIAIRVNAGALPASSWVHDPAAGGGRIIGEACHFIDLALHLAGSRIRDVQAAALGAADAGAALHDNVQITLRFEDGSIASIVYTAKGNPRSGKERIEVFTGGTTAVIDDFRSAVVHGEKDSRWTGRADKGHVEQLRSFLAAARTGRASPIGLDELADGARATLTAAALVMGAAPQTVYQENA
jgi:predicted dehydrogenase/threonine dehydrogenase-like Zn-dependent dehydrogenase